MEAVIIDTDVFSYLMKPKDTRGDRYRPHVKGKTVAVSFITVGELYHWAEKRKWSDKSRQNLEERLKAVVIVPYDAELCRTYGRVRASLPPGLVVAANDLWIAACAIRHGVTLITNNRKHFERISGLTIVSEAPTLTRPIPAPGDLFDSIKNDIKTIPKVDSRPDRPRILLVEDEQPIRDVIVPWLFRNGFDCREAADGRAAMELLATGTRIDVILSNLLLPLVDGLTLLQHAKQKYPRLPFAFVTALNDSQVREEVMRNGADGFILKPFTEGEFIALVRGMVRKSTRQ
jgi:tRNA(fMet)-specific endonuclease VapC